MKQLKQTSHFRQWLWGLALILVMLPALSFADVGGPVIAPVDCIVTNPEGAVYYVFSDSLEEWTVAEDRIPCGTVLSVSDDFYDSFTAGETEQERFGGAGYQDGYVYVNLEDLQICEENDPLQTAEVLDTERTFRVMAEDGIAVYAGPSAVYGQTGTLPRGSVIVFTHGVTSEFDYNAFNYGSCGEVSGWFCTQDTGSAVPVLAEKLNESSVYAGVLKVIDGDVCLLDGNMEEPAAVSGPLPVDTILSFDYMVEGYDISYAVVQYCGTEGYLPIGKMVWDYEADTVSVGTGLLVYEQDRYVIPEEDMELYARAGDKNSAAGYLVPKGSILGVEAVYMEDSEGGSVCDGWYMVSCDGHHGFLYYENRSVYNPEVLTDELYSVECYDSFTVFRDHSAASEVVADCETSDGMQICRSYYNEAEDCYFYYVVGPDFSGWACGGIYEDEYLGKGGIALMASTLGTEVAEAEVPEEVAEALEEAEEAAVQEEAQVPDVQESAPAALEEETESDPAARALNESVRSSGNTLILMICAAVIGAVTAAAVVLLMGKKKEQKQKSGKASSDTEKSE